MKKKLLALVVAVSGLVLAVSPMAMAQTYDLTSDFSIYNGNPNGVWSYGFMWDNMQNYANVSSSSPDLFVSGMNGWLWPYTFKNTRTTDWDDGYTITPAGTIATEGSSGGAAHAGEWTAVKFTSPITGTLDIAVRWWGEYYGSSKGSTADVHVLLNGVSVFDGMVAGFAGKTGTAAFGVYEQMYNGSIQVNEGDSIILASGNGLDGSSADRVGLSATIEATAVPEPSSILALFAGLSGVGGFVLRRRK